VFKKLTVDDHYDHIVEPSAGKGVFYKLIPTDVRIGLDLEPKYDGVTRMNYFDFIPDSDKKYAVVGNPPFGKISSLAVKFFNKSAEYANTIAFIVPRTFKRTSVQNILNMNFHLIYNMDLPIKPCCFEPNMSAKCSFKIWIKKNVKRSKQIYDKTHKDFNFVKHGPKDEDGQPTPPTDVHFAVKSYGSNCGVIQNDGLEKLRPKSWHWIKSNICVIELKKRFKSLDYSISKDTVRQDSLGQQELIHLYKCKYG
jgi:hypothetical protein